MLSFALFISAVVMLATFAFSLEYEDFRDRAVFLVGAVCFCLLVFLSLWLFGGVQ